MTWQNKANVSDRNGKFLSRMKVKSLLKHLLNWPLSPILPHRQQLHKVTFVSPLFLSWDQDTYTYFIISVITIFSKSCNIPTQITIQVIFLQNCTEVQLDLFRPQICDLWQGSGVLEWSHINSTVFASCVDTLSSVMQRPQLLCQIKMLLMRKVSETLQLIFA